MKELSEFELANLSREERYKYYDDLNAYKWSALSPEEKDIDICSSQAFFANRRGIEEMNLEEQLESSLIPDRTREFAESYTFFWGTRSPFSQWHSSAFRATTILNEGISDMPAQKRKHIVKDLFPLDVQEYSSAEQFMMYHKAMIFLDREIAQKIMATDDATQIKKLGREVKNYDEYVWKYFRSKVVYEGNKAKFTQNEEIMNTLYKTKGTTLVEAAPDDSIWGIGLPETDPRALRRETWLGMNLLGEILTQIRVELMGEY